MPKQHLIQPYFVGKGKRSLAMIIPSEIVKSLRIHPQSIFLLLKVGGINDIQLKIIREEDLMKKGSKNMIPADKVSEASPADIITTNK